MLSSKASAARAFRENVNSTLQGIGARIPGVESLTRGLGFASGLFGRGGSGGGGLLPGLSNISNIIQAIPQIGNLAHSLISPLTDATEAGVRFNMTIENAVAGFEGIAGGADKALAHVQKLRRFSEDSPIFDLESVLRTSRVMNAFGFSLDEQIPK